MQGAARHGHGRNMILYSYYFIAGGSGCLLVQQRTAESYQMMKDDTRTYVITKKVPQVQVSNHSVPKYTR